MKEFKTTQLFDVNDLISWYQAGRIHFCTDSMNSIDSEDVKATFMDCLVKGYPLPSIYIQQKIDVENTQTHRHVLYGHLMTETIVNFVLNETPVTNKIYANTYYRELPVNVKEAVLHTQLVFEVIHSKDESAIKEMLRTTLQMKEECIS